MLRIRSCITLSPCYPVTLVDRDTGPWFGELMKLNVHRREDPVVVGVAQVHEEVLGVAIVDGDDLAWSHPAREIDGANLSQEWRHHRHHQGFDLSEGEEGG